MSLCFCRAYCVYEDINDVYVARVVSVLSLVLNIRLARLLVIKLR